jgi:hypothetical protein
MVERDGERGVANKSDCTSDWLIYCKLRNDVINLNKKKKKLCYEAKINDIKNYLSLIQMAYSSQNHLI